MHTGKIKMQTSAGINTYAAKVLLCYDYYSKICQIGVNGKAPIKTINEK